MVVLSENRLFFNLTFYILKRGERERERERDTRAHTHTHNRKDT